MFLAALNDDDGVLVIASTATRLVCVAAPLLLIACGAAPIPAAPESPRHGPSISSAPPQPTAIPVTPRPRTECGLLEVERDDLVTRGAGENHPEKIRVEKSLSTCSIDVLEEHAWCADLLANDVPRLHTTYGPRHPEALMTRAHRAFCERWFGARMAVGSEAPRCIEAKARGAAPIQCDRSIDAPPTPEECRAWSEDLERLRAAGKAERHPLVLATTAKLASCK